MSNDKLVLGRLVHETQLRNNQEAVKRIGNDLELIERYTYNDPRSVELIVMALEDIHEILLRITR